MKRENVIFLILVFAAAIVFGTTFGIINGYLDTVSKHPSKKPSIEHRQNDDSPAVKETSKPEEAQNAIPAGSAASSMGTGQGSGASVMPLTATEAREIAGMLLQLGYRCPSLGSAVEAYQRDHGLAATGIIDNATLASVLRQLALKKVHSLVE